MKPPRTILAFLLLASVWLVRPAQAAQPRAGKVELGLYGGYYLLSSDNQLGNAPDPTRRSGNSGLFGGRASYNFTDLLAIEAEADGAFATFQDSHLAATILGWRGSLLWHFSAGRFRPFVLAGLGGQSLIWQEYGTQHDTDVTAHCGAGLKVDINDWLDVRADLRYLLADGATARFSHSFAGHIGLSAQFDWLKKPVIRDGDSDGDGIVDSRDGCPEQPEDKDGFQDDDGCPDLDNDGDGTPDARDACPNEAGLAQNDGCPLRDKDGDGIDDRRDKCPNEPEIFNGVDDDDGCPDGAQTVIVSKQEVRILEQVNFEAGNAVIQPGSYRVLDAVAAALQEHSELTRVVVEGHTDDVGKAQENQALSLLRAQAVVKYLTDKGVAPARLAAAGFGSKRPLCTDLTSLRKMEACRDTNRRVEFHVVEVDGKPAKDPARNAPKK